MLLHDSHPLIPMDAVVFDCDGTLSSIEGIDELAEANGVGAAVKKLTEEAMGHTGINPQLYRQRLALVLPTVKQVRTLGEKYFLHKTADLLTVLQVLTDLGKAVYVVSAGLYPAVVGFALRLNLPQSHVFAVEVYFDDSGNYLDFDHRSPLVLADGKRHIVEQLKKQHPRLVYVGDGLNDMATQDIVTRFVGYGGAYYRENIRQMCQYYITEPSMLPLLPLCLTAEEMQFATS
ncbi:MAG TPA: HAD-IB family phosphatase [Gammaproteobacteria bacterium]|nr:HAD-IB family phosphatase [Gammaproteobacteria bacterium]